MNFKLLSRDDFREGVFARDKFKCVFCDLPAVDAHHIIERRLWPDGGYYLENGASVCGEHHMMCEMTILSVEEVREAAGIRKVCVPDVLYDDHQYDKWGNPVLSNGRRTRGPLFYDESVQKVLGEGGVLDLFDHYVKAGKTMHLPWSPGIHNDDRVIRNLAAFEGQEVVVTIKMDGENTMMYSDYIHARSIDGRNHPSRSWVKQFHAQIQGDIPEKWRLNGENVFAQHSIKYDDLESYFYGFALWDERNNRLDWDDMLTWFQMLGVTPARQLWRGIWDEKAIRDLPKKLNFERDEGFVVTTVKGFPFREYHQKVAKYVRKGHVQTNKHWMHGQAVVPNQLKS
jgi:hypothetical protein